MRQRGRPPKTVRGSSIPKIAQDAPRASARETPSMPKRRRRTSMCQRCKPRETARRSSIPIRKKLHAPAWAPAETAIHVENSHGATARAFQHARSPQRIRRRLKTRTAPQRERFDTHDSHDPRRRLARELQNSHGPKARAIRPARNAERIIARELPKKARRHNESVPTRTKVTKPAECSPR